jgi:hypothetical protein
MKIIKLNRRYKQFKEHGHFAGLRFHTWSHRAQVVENAFKDITRTNGWDRGGAWYAYFGKVSRRTDARPYFITVRDESLLTMALLKVNND